MNNGVLIFLGIFVALGLSWAGIVVTNQVQYGGMEPVGLQEGDEAFPRMRSGLASRGELVYQEMGCVYCHSQQVRRPGFGADTERGWGERQSVARDYIRQERVFLGTMRTGPDLKNVGDRAGEHGDYLSESWHHLHLYNPRITSPGSTMPPFAFLYEERRIVGEPSRKALDLPGDHAPAPGYEIVPGRRAEALVAYLQSLTIDYELPEARRLDDE